MYKFIGKKNQTYDIKLNYNCPDSEKTGVGPGSCGGGSNNSEKQTNEKTVNSAGEKLLVSNLQQEKNIQKGKHPAEPSDSWIKSAEKLPTGVYKKGNTYRLGENIAIVEKGEKMAYAVSTNGTTKKEFSTQNQANFAAETYAKTGKFPEKPSYDGEFKFKKQPSGKGTNEKIMLPLKDKSGRNIKYK